MKMNMREIKSLTAAMNVRKGKILAINRAHNLIQYIAEYGLGREKMTVYLALPSCLLK